MGNNRISTDQISLAQPSSPDEWQDYFMFRWQHLRAPWGQPPGSEKDEFEHAACHVLARTASGDLVGVGRIHFPDVGIGQIRYMATREDMRGRGIGTAIVNELERIAKGRGARVIVMNARASAVSFYEALGYEVCGAAPTLFGVIGHKKLRKAI